MGQQAAAASADAHVYKKTTTHPGMQYLRIQMVFGDGALVTDPVLLKTMIAQALQELHGQVGAAIQVDVLKTEGSTGSALLRVNTTGLVKLQSALTLFARYDRRPCTCTVVSTSPFLSGMAANSRQWAL